MSTTKMLGLFNQKLVIVLLFSLCSPCWSAVKGMGNDLIFQSSFEEVAMLLWSDPNTWGGSVPVDGDNVTIEQGQTVLLDVDTAALSGLTIVGSLIFDQQDLSLTSDWIMVNGLLQIGSSNQPHAYQAIITLTGDDPNINPTTRGLMVSDGTLELHGVSPTTIWSKINQHINAGANQINVLQTQGWKQGDQLVLAPTDYYGVSESQQLEITAVNGNQVNLVLPVDAFHWGLMQYLTSNGMSLTEDGSVTPPAVTGYTPLELDERAEIGNLTRNIVIQAPDDELWQNDGFGAHVMIMTLNSTVHVDGVEFRRVGQAGVLGRYPFHWHFLSYLADGTEMGDVNDHYLRNSSIHDSSNRCITIHGTNGTVIQNNICFDILGHAIFFEDAVERRNLVEGNLVLKVRFPTVQNALKLHDIDVQIGLSTGSSALWVSNPDNIIRDNVFADSQGFGMWMAFPVSPVGVGSNVPLLPFRMEFGDFDNNVMHSNQLRGVMFDNSEIDEQGTVAPLQYASLSATQELQRFTITGWQLWKNADGNFWDHVVWPTFNEFVSADSSGKFFAGSGAEGLITRTLLIGSSLNNLSPRPHPWMGPPTAMATYHSAFDMRDNIIVNFPFVEDKTSGAFATDDYYLRPVEKGQIRNSGNLLINSHSGYRSDAAVDEEIAFNFAQGFTYFVFAGALWDPHGLWGPANNWSVYNQPFFTHNANCSPITPISQNASSCDGAYFGVDRFVLDQANQPYDDFMAIDITRYNDNNPALIVGNWVVDSAQPGWSLAQMRHFAARESGIFSIEFPDEITLPVDVAMTISNIHQSSENLMLGIQFSGNITAQVFTSTHPYDDYITDNHAGGGNWAFKHDYTAVASRQQVIDSNGETFWQDTASNMVWVKVTYADLQQFFPPDGNEFSDSTLYNTFHLRVWSAQ